MDCFRVSKKYLHDIRTVTPDMIEPGPYKFVQVDGEIIFHHMMRDCPQHVEMVPTGMTAEAGGSVTVGRNFWIVLLERSATLNLGFAKNTRKLPTEALDRSEVGTEDI